MKRLCVLFLFAIVVLGILCTVASRALQVERKRAEQFHYAYLFVEQDCEKYRSAERRLNLVVVDLLAERDALRDKLKAAESRGESVEVAVFREKLQEVEKRLEHAKQDRDNLANALSESRDETRRTASELAKVLDENDKLRAIDEADKDALRRKDGDINCLREELKRAQSCVQCHQSHRVEHKQRRHR